MHRRTRFLTASFAIGLLAALSAPRSSAQTGTITCESRGNDREQCAIERGARVELSRQVSQTPCRENANWGVGQGYIWVSGGCRAQFTVTAGKPTVPASNAAATPMQLRACRAEADRRLAAYTYDQISVVSESRQGSVANVRWRAGTAGGLCTVVTTGRIVRFTTDGAAGADGGQVAAGRTTRITCESRGTDREECPIAQGARVRLVRQISQSPCRLNDTYGTGQGYLWVAQGCRAEFEVTEPAAAPVTVPQPAGGAAATSTITCQSIGNTLRQCPIPEGASVRLVRQASTSACRERETWGTGATFIWVNRGCAGEFEVTRRGAPSGGTGAAGAVGAPERVTCESKGGERSECRVRAGGQVRLVRQLSTTACVYNSSWGTAAGKIWVANGCRGEFEVR